MLRPSRLDSGSLIGWHSANWLTRTPILCPAGSMLLHEEPIMNLTGKSALVTGASRGLGRALAEQLAAAGARVVLVARSGPELLASAQAIRDAGGEAHALVYDVSRKEDVYRLVGAAAALVGP